MVLTFEHNPSWLFLIVMGIAVLGVVFFMSWISYHNTWGCEYNNQTNICWCYAKYFGQEYGYNYTESYCNQLNNESKVR